MWELEHKESWVPKNRCFFELQCWKRLLRVPWTARRSNQWILKEINPEYSLEGLMLKLKLQFFGGCCCCCCCCIASVMPNSVQHAQLIDGSPPGSPVLHHLPELVQTHVHWVGEAIQPSHPLSSPSPPAFNVSQHQVFSNKSVFPIRWPKYWSFSFSISPSKEYSGPVSSRIDWFDLFAVQGTLKSFFQHYRVQKHPFFGVQLSL